MARVHEKLELQVLPRELEDIELENTPQNNLLEDETQNKQTFPQLAEELEPMPEVADHYSSTDNLLFWGKHMARGHVVAQSFDANGNVIIWAHANLILDTRMYQVDFTGGEVTEFTTNVFVESINSQCDADGNEWLFFDLLIVYHMNNNANFPHRSVNQYTGQISNLKVHWMLANLLPVEREFYLLVEVL